MPTRRPTRGRTIFLSSSSHFISKQGEKPLSKTAILKDGGQITLKKGNVEKYGVFSNRSRIGSKEFGSLREAKSYFNKMKRK